MRSMHAQHRVRNVVFNDGGARRSGRKTGRNGENQRQSAATVGIGTNEKRFIGRAQWLTERKASRARSRSLF